jgi:hypothetical protein
MLAGAKYIGDFIDGVFEGNGTLYYADKQRIYEGEFKNWTKTGFGTFTDTQSNTTYVGYFLNDKLDGYGVYENKIKQKNTREPFQHIDIRAKNYWGYFSQGRFHGDGDLRFHRQRPSLGYKGAFDNGKMTSAGFYCDILVLIQCFLLNRDHNG